MVAAVYEQQISPADYDGMITSIIVSNPLLTSGKYTTYAITVDTNDPSFSLKHSSVRRRYSDFVILREILVKQHPCIKIPHLPGKSLFKSRFTEAFIEKRREGLEIFLNKICSVPIYLSDKAVHLFLQSTFCMDVIKDILKGNPLDFSIAVDYILSKNSRTHEVSSVGYEEFSKFNSLSAFEVDNEDLQTSYARATTVPDNTANSSVSPKQHSLTSSPAAKKVSFSDTVVVALVHTH